MRAFRQGWTGAAASDCQHRRRDTSGGLRAEKEAGQALDAPLRSAEATAALLFQERGGEPRSVHMHQLPVDSLTIQALQIIRLCAVCLSCYSKLRAKARSTWQCSVRQLCLLPAVALSALQHINWEASVQLGCKQPHAMLAGLRTLETRNCPHKYWCVRPYIPRVVH